jgi:hypothetical protein
LEPLARDSLRRLRQITQGRGDIGTPAERRGFAEWISQAIAPRNIAGLADPARQNLYPVDFDVLVERHARLGMSRDQLVEGLPALRGMGPPAQITSSRERGFCPRPGELLGRDLL